MFNRLAIATRLLMAFGAMGAILLVLAGVGLMGQRVAEHDVATLKRQSGNAIQTERVARLFAQTRVLINDALADGDAAAWGKALESLAATREQQAKLVGSIVNADRRAKAEAMATLTTRYQEVLRQARAGGGDAAGALASARELAGRIDAEADHLTTAIRDSSARATAAADAEMVAMGRWALVVAGVGAALALLLTFRISRSIAQPLARMGSAMDAVVAGEVATVVPCLDRHDAIGQMARAVEVFRRNAEENQHLQAEQDAQRRHAEAAKHDALCVMAETVEGEADAAIDDISRLTGDMAEAVERLCHVALRTSQGASASAASAEQVLASADAVAAATRQLHASIAEIGAQLEHTRTIARKAVAATQSAQEVMAGLTEATKRIGRVVGLISTVAGKTNLLALNATIEAARAGEAGKGFSVVAGEVKGLANQTEHATGEIGEQIQAILAVADQALEVMGAITATIAEVENGATAIATAIEEQSAATSEIARAVDHTSDASRHVASLMADMAEEARQSSELSDEVKKDGARVTETMAGFGRTIGRVIRTSTPEVDRRADRRYGVYVPARVVLADGARDATLTNLSAAGVAVQVAGAALAPGQRVRLDCPALAAEAMTVLAVEGGTVHAVFADNFRLSDETVARVGQDGALALLEKAQSDHQGFVAGVMAVLDGQAATKAADLANHHTCRLGKWYDGVSDGRILSCPAFGALVEPHQRVHQSGKAALAAHWRGDAAAARAAAEDLRQASAEVVALLGQLAAEVRGGAAGVVAAA